MFDATLARTRAAHLSADQLFARHLRLQDPDARDELIVRYMPFARKLALRYSYTDEPVEDLVQVACVGAGRHRPVRAGSRQPVRDLRRADNPWRAQAPFP